MAGDPRRRNWDEEPPQYDDPDKFTVHIEHNGFFCGLKENLCYVSGSADYWDYCNTDTFSLLWIEEFIKQGGNEMTARTSVYWCLPGKSLSDGLCLIENDSHILAMMAAVNDEAQFPPKTLCLMVDHTNFLKNLREDVPVQIPAKYTCRNGGEEATEKDDGGDEAAEKDEGGDEAAEKDDGGDEAAEKDDGGDEAVEDEDGDTDSEFYDSDWDVEDGDDDLFLANTDKDVNDNNEPIEIIEEEDDAGLDHDDLHLTKEQHLQLKYKFKEFNPEVDMETPIFKLGMVFSSMPEFRKALNAYSVNERVKLRKPRNEAKHIVLTKVEHQVQMLLHQSLQVEEGEVRREDQKMQVRHNLQIEEADMAHITHVLDQRTTCCLVMTKTERGVLHYLI